MRKLLQKILIPPVLWLANKFSSRPDRARIHAALTALYQEISEGDTKKGLILTFDCNKDRFIILSDQHKGAKNDADDFAIAEKNYLAALDYYYQNDFYYINLGDSEELWENTLYAVKKHNKISFKKERSFSTAGKFTKIFGNHDLYWDNDPFAAIQLDNLYGENLRTYEGMILQTKINGSVLKIFLTHGHQGDLQSDGNWFSKWFVANVWARLQAYLRLNPNTPAYDVELKTVHNRLMYEWSSEQTNILLITGHTHQPVFESLTHLERLYRKLDLAIKANDTSTIEEMESEIKPRRRNGHSIPDFSTVVPMYFNSGCCCFSDGDITGIEITDGKIRLIKWAYDTAGNPTRIVLEESELSRLITMEESIKN